MTPAAETRVIVGDCDRSVVGLSFFRERFGESEIQNLYVSVQSDHDVGGLQITVDDAFFMRFFERLGYLARQLASFLDRDRAPLQACGEVFSFH